MKHAGGVDGLVDRHRLYLRTPNLGEKMRARALLEFAKNVDESVTSEIIDSQPASPPALSPILGRLRTTGISRQFLP